jgi:hypothetical protein
MAIIVTDTQLEAMVVESLRFLREGYETGNIAVNANISRVPWGQIVPPQHFRQHLAQWHGDINAAVARRENYFIAGSLQTVCNLIATLHRQPIPAWVNPDVHVDGHFLVADLNDLRQWLDHISDEKGHRDEFCRLHLNAVKMSRWVTRINATRKAIRIARKAATETTLQQEQMPDVLINIVLQFDGVIGKWADGSIEEQQSP